MLGDLAQRDPFSVVDDNIGDIGARTADQAWLYNQIAANLNGLPIVGSRWAPGARSGPAVLRGSASSGWQFSE